MKKEKSEIKSGSTHHSLVQCDLEFSRFQLEMEDLEIEELRELNRCIDKIEKMTWAQILATASKGAGKRGLNWEPIAGQRTSNGVVIASIRVTKKCRARVTRDGVFMRFISLHPDHDSAYEETGGEGL